VCPICNTPIAVPPGNDPNLVLDEHINHGCKKQGPPNYRCSTDNCKVVDVVPFICNKCKRHHCVRHRFETDHNCPGKPVRKNPPKQVPPPPLPQHVSHTPPNLHVSNSNSRSAHKYVGIRQTNGQIMTQTVTPNTTLREVHLFIDANRSDGSNPYKIFTTYPVRELTHEDLDKTIEQLGLMYSLLTLHNVNDENVNHNTNNNNNDEGGGWWDTMKKWTYSLRPW